MIVRIKIFSFVTIVRFSQAKTTLFVNVIYPKHVIYLIQMGKNVKNVVCEDNLLLPLMASWCLYDVLSYTTDPNILDHNIVFYYSTTQHWRGLLDKEHKTNVNYKENYWVLFLFGCNDIDVSFLDVCLMVFFLYSRILILRVLFYSMFFFSAAQNIHSQDRWIA